MQRCLEFDIMKGIAILLVMLGHTHIFYGNCELPELVQGIIGSFHVPLFFFVAGYFSKPFANDYCSVLKEYAKRLLIPYAITMIVVILYNAILAWKRADANVVMENVVAFLTDDPSGWWLDKTGYTNMGVGPVWFLLALFWAKACFLFLSKYEKWFLPIAIGLSWVGSVLSPILPLPFGFWQGINAVGFVAVGYWCRTHKLYWWVQVLFVCTWMICLIAHVGMNPYGASYPIYPLNLVEALGATIVVYWLSRGILHLQSVSKILTSLGENSMNILCAHTMDMKCNAIRLVLKQIPLLVEWNWLALTIDYMLVLAVSYLPKFRFRSEKTKL